MKKRLFAAALSAAMCMSLMAGCGQNAGSNISASSTGNTASTEATTDTGNTAETAGAVDGEMRVFKVGIVQYVDDASLNQIEAAIEEELDKKGAELGVIFDYGDTVYNGQADSTIINQIATQLLSQNVDVIIPIATPTAMIMQAATEDNQIPVVFSAVSDPVGAGLVATMDAPGANITGTSDGLNTQAVFDLMFAAQPDITKVGLLYDKSQDSSTAPINDAKAILDAKGIAYVEKTGTSNDEIMLAADALVAEGVQAVFTPTDNSIMTAELAIYEKFADAGVAHYCGADSFALNGAFCGFGVNYYNLGLATADMAVEILVNGADPASTKVMLLDNGIATVNTETAAAIGLDYSMFESMCAGLVEITTAKEFN